MKAILAEQLLAKIMEWTPEEISEERPLLQAMANLKYDEYHQFSPGIRFIESLAQWLGQFQTNDERKIMYSFVREKLIFISSDQMAHLVELSYSIVINPIIINEVARTLAKEKYQIKKIVESPEYKNTKRKSLFIGLSDGSRVDQLRRYAKLSNEQVLTTYYIDDEKISEMLLELQRDHSNAKYSNIFLIDDFTASGTSYARFNEENEGKGKILKLLKKIFIDQANTGSINFSDLVSKDNLAIHLIFYLATKEALDRINECVNTWKEKNEIGNLSFTVEAIQLLDNQNQYLNHEPKFVDIIKSDQYFDNSIVDRHYSMGKISRPYLGFNECGLPLVLFHNTPNNSLPIIWFSEDKSVKGLFPRITRHKE